MESRGTHTHRRVRENRPDTIIKNKKMQPDRYGHTSRQKCHAK
jgi:hypothetical protein